MPGLLRGVVRTAAVAGTATAVSNRVSRRQEQRWAAQDAPPPQQFYAAPPQEYAAPPQQYAAPPAEDPLDQLKELGELKKQGILTEAEFAQQKARILGG
jgi:hypothetical protein